MDVHEKHFSRITTAEIGFYRRTIGKTKIGRIQNETIQHELDIDQLRKN